MILAPGSATERDPLTPLSASGPTDLDDEVCCGIGMFHEVIDAPVGMLVVGGQECKYVVTVMAAQQPGQGGTRSAAVA